MVRLKNFIGILLNIQSFSCFTPKACERIKSFLEAAGVNPSSCWLNDPG
jgi:hypothetical protein